MSVGIDSNRIIKDVTADEKSLYLREIKKDIKYFGKTYERAHFRIGISGLAPKEAACLVKETLKGGEPFVRFSISRKALGMVVVDDAKENSIGF